MPPRPRSTMFAGAQPTACHTASLPDLLKYAISSCLAGERRLLRNSRRARPPAELSEPPRGCAAARSSLRNAPNTLMGVTTPFPSPDAIARAEQLTREHF